MGDGIHQGFSSGSAFGNGHPNRAPTFLRNSTRLAEFDESESESAGAPLKGYAVVTKQPYSSWLQREPTTLYLLRRPYVPWPPVSQVPTSAFKSAR